MLGGQLCHCSTAVEVAVEVLGEFCCCDEEKEELILRSFTWSDKARTVCSRSRMVV